MHLQLVSTGSVLVKFGSCRTSDSVLVERYCGRKSFERADCGSRSRADRGSRLSGLERTIASSLGKAIRCLDVWRSRLCR